MKSLENKGSVEGNLLWQKMELKVNNDVFGITFFPNW